MPPTMIETFAAGACVAIADAAALADPLGAALGVTVVPPQAAEMMVAVIASAQMRLRMCPPSYYCRASA